MKIEAGEAVVRMLLLSEVAKMVLILKADMQEVHIEYFCDYILNHYDSYTISDLTVLTDRLVKNNPYGKPILQNLIHELDEYSNERFMYAEQARIKDASLHKELLIPESKILELYDKMIEKGKEKKETEKDRIERIKLEQESKLKTMEMLYGTDQIYSEGL